MESDKFSVMIERAGVKGFSQSNLKSIQTAAARQLVLLRPKPKFACSDVSDRWPRLLGGVTALLIILNFATRNARTGL